MQLFMRTLRTTIIGLVAFGILIFGPAGTFAYWQGWTFIVVFSVSTTVTSPTCWPGRRGGSPPRS